MDALALPDSTLALARFLAQFSFWHKVDQDGSSLGPGRRRRVVLGAERTEPARMIDTFATDSATNFVFLPPLSSCAPAEQPLRVQICRLRCPADE